MDVGEIVQLVEATSDIGLAGDELTRLVELLVEYGATPDEIVAAAATGSPGGLALDLAVRSGGEALEFRAATAAAGLTVTEAERIWTALGFPDPTGTGRRLDPASVDALHFLATTGRDLLGPEHSVGLTRYRRRDGAPGRGRRRRVPCSLRGPTTRGRVRLPRRRRGVRRHRS
ncbi:MAG: hypothetical protein H0W46_07510 [Acidimicrobiia bacterium]|nr:hypothetical protein [Acidimicrobiia bacterium]